MRKIPFILAFFILASSAPPNAFGKTSEESFVFTAAGDFGATANTTAVLEGISATDSSFHLAVGDLSYNQIRPESAWRDYVRLHLRQDLPFEVLAGNHEENGFNGLIDDFSKVFPDELGARGDYGKEYYFDFPKINPLARFILISPNIHLKVGGTYSYNKGNSHYAWLSKEIDEARGLGLRWVIVGMHENCLSAGWKSCEIGEELLNLLVEKKVDLVLQGHDHNYQRSKALGIGGDCPQIRAGSYNSACVADAGTKNVFEKGIGTIIVIVGTGGKSNYSIHTKDPEAPYFARLIGSKNQPTYGFGRFTVSTDEIKGEFVPCNKGLLSLLFKDEFHIVDSGSRLSKTQAVQAESPAN